MAYCIEIPRESEIIHAADLLRTVAPITGATIGSKLGDALFFSLLEEEVIRIRTHRAFTWAKYRALSRAGSAIALGGRDKRAVFNALRAADLV